MGEKQLSFHLYEGNGNLRLAKGTPLDEEALAHLQFVSLFKQEEIAQEETNPNDLKPEAFHHEGQLFLDVDAALSDDEKALAREEENLSYIYSPQSNDLMFRSLQSFWMQMEAGKSPDVALCEMIRDEMVSELTHKADQIHALTQLQVRDHYTYSHTLHVAALSVALAIKAGYDEEAIQEIGLAAILHDLGKFMIPKHIMFKTGRLTEKEFEVMKLHPGFGHKIIVEQLKLPEHIARPALEHQEMHSGGGYPQNLKGNEIHPYSQIVKVADVYEALTAKRPYKDPIPSTKALQIMHSEGPKSFNPELLAHFSEMANFQPDAPVV
jgi:response regulator RpfG family c-di-GMP phosphodiesterase